MIVENGNEIIISLTSLIIFIKWIITTIEFYLYFKL